MELKICVVGCGMIGREHIERIQNRIKGASVVAVCDVFEAGAKKGAEIAGPGTKVYTGMIVGRSSRPGDIDVNVCKKKHLTSIRNAAGAEEALKITNVRIPTLEEALEFIAEDELVEITPKSIRMRKRVLNVETRKKLASRASK